MYRIFFGFLVPVFLLACNTSGTPSEAPVTDTDQAAAADTTSSDSAEAVNVTGCYLRVLKKDTLVASLHQDGDSITGRLTFNNFQKDGSTGTVAGTLNGDLVRLIYTFHSEGMKSVMEVYFRVVNDGLIRGFGDVTTRNDTAYFNKPDSLTYRPSDILASISCEQLPAKYK